RKRIKATTVRMLCRLKREVYADFSVRHFYEQVSDKHGIRVCRHDDRRPTAAKNPLISYRTAAGSEPVREWRKGLDETERQAIGKDLLRAQWRWPVGMPLCRPMGNGLWEVRTDLPTKRTARVLLCLYREHLVALHGFIKKTRATPDEDLATARRRQ